MADIVDSREVERSAVERNFMINIDYRGVVVFELQCFD